MTYQIIPAKDSAYNRHILEQKKGIILVGLEQNNEKDNPKYLSSGLNSIIARIASKNNNKIGINLETLQDKTKIEKARLLARIAQNIKICREAGTCIAIHGEKDRDSMREFLSSLGASTSQSSQAISF